MAQNSDFFYIKWYKNLYQIFEKKFWYKNFCGKKFWYIKTFFIWKFYWHFSELVHKNFTESKMPPKKKLTKRRGWLIVLRSTWIFASCLLSLWLCRFRMQKLSEVFPWWIWSKTSHDPEFCKIFFETWCWLVDTRIFNSISSKSRIRSR